MRLTAEQIDYIENDIRERGITLTELAESLSDHICCFIENNNEQEFNVAYANALDSFGNDGIYNVQKETQFILTLKKEKFMKKSMFILGYISVILVSTGMLFKLQQWPGAAMMLVMGVLLLNFGFLPMYFMDRYKRSVQFN